MKITKKLTPIMTSWNKNPTQQTCFFFILICQTSRAFRGFEQLSSLICCQVHGWPKLGLRGQIMPFVKLFDMLESPRYAEKSIKGSNNSDDSLVSKQSLSQKYGSLGWRQGPGKLSQKGESIPALRRYSQKTPNPKRKTFFFI